MYEFLHGRGERRAHVSLKLWNSGRRFVRYRSLCIQHRYRGSGGYDSAVAKEQRRNTEGEAIRSLARKHPKLVSFHEKPNASLGQQQYKFKNLGEVPLTMRPPTAEAGRPHVGCTSRAMTAAARKMKSRNGHRRLGASDD